MAARNEGFVVAANNANTHPGSPLVVFKPSAISFFADLIKEIAAAAVLGETIILVPETTIRGGFSTCPETIRLWAMSSSWKNE
ncbi:MAG: hypothetical protein ABLT11_02830, partial [Candidatus Acidiferrum sp.]